ncbi:hypothetical protein SBOR_4360 [Sclerotinia borealis F-4128]|uniref:Mfs allantoate protein n=1 Tax=Sclerotinia borealis (strain F-4128) TaxID=1432307 RepID=W9CH15_SCLBF|nr:hypothetical protein SBOR_4360 [Sclerotinia borealis F-4128]
MDINSLTQCSALNLSDEKRCLETATSVNGLFCSFHSKQCQGLYRGYKLRTARLERLDRAVPLYFANTKTSLGNETFKDVTTEAECKELHDWLWTKYQLLERVIRARRLHHSRFFSQNMDYGHAKFLDQLTHQKAYVTKALERLERRTAEILYRNQQWFKWVRECQDNEEAHREKEQKKIKQEAQLWQRNWQQAKQIMEEKMRREEKKKQDTFLEKIYKEKMKEVEENEGTEDDMDWDPIEDELEDGRGNFIDLMRHFLWVSAEEQPKTEGPPSSETDKNGLAENSVASQEPTPNTTNVAEVISQLESSTLSKKSKKKKKENAAATTAASSQAASGSKPVPKPQVLPDKSLIESREDMHNRLARGIKIDFDNVNGIMVAGTIENPYLQKTTRTFTEFEIQRLLLEVSEIKHLLFCRLLLGHAALLPAALRADSIEAFFEDEEVTGTALRNVCLKMEKPSLQEIRDACADFFRSGDEEKEEQDEPEAQDDDTDDHESHEAKLADPYDVKMRLGCKKRGELPGTWRSKREISREAAAENMLDMAPGMAPSMKNILGEGGAIDFGDSTNSRQIRKKIRVKICGRTIWNYPSDEAMSRGGWLHFSIIAKDSNLNTAIELCRNWEEFFELNILACWGYFPASNWASWVGNRLKQQSLQLGFIMYYESSDPDAKDLSVSFSQGGRSKQTRRQHAIFQARNVICAHIKRDDQASRRFIQYLSMQSHQLVLLVRDAESGKLLVKPPEEERWLWREKSGLGRAVKNVWNVLKRIGPEFFEEMDRHRQWNFSFKDYYDIYVWDLEPGETLPGLFNTVQHMLIKALRCGNGKDLYQPAASILKTLYRDKDSHYRDVRPGDTVQLISQWDFLQDQKSTFFYGEIDGPKPTEPIDSWPSNLFYNEADTLEDEVLFPEERAEEASSALVAVGKKDSLRAFEEEDFSIKRFVEGTWNWESEDSEDSDDAGDSEDESQGSHEKAFEDGDNDGSVEDDGDDGDDDDDNEEDYSKDIPEELWAVVKRLALEKARKDDDPNDDLEGEFMRFIEKTTSRAFKKAWHQADFTPNGQERYLEMKKMAHKSWRYNLTGRDFFKSSSTMLNFQVMSWMNVTADGVKDAQKAVGKVYPFFNPEFLDAEEGKEFKDSLMFNQEERAKHYPDTRTDKSTIHHTKEFYAKLDKSCREMKFIDNYTSFPSEWDMKIRPIIAKLYKSGIIRSHALPEARCRAFQGTEATRPSKPDLFVDMRSIISSLEMPYWVEDPSKLPPLLTTARQFSTSHPNAKFAILRLWSAPYFYPLTVGHDKRDGFTFYDLTGRVFTWLFVPKDMPNSELSMHVACKNRIAPFKKQFGDKVVAKRDKYLVMGTDEKELEKIVAGVTYAVQMRSWRQEIDLWRSFINVDLGFLERLDEKWWE